MVSIVRSASIFFWTDRACTTNRVSSSGPMSSSRAGSVPCSPANVLYATQVSSRSSPTCALQPVLLMTVCTSTCICGCSDVEPVSAAPVPADSAASEHVGVPDITGFPGVVWIAVIVEGVTGVAPDVSPCTSNGVLAGSTETRLSYCFIKISVSYLCEWVVGMQIRQIVCVQLVRS